MSITAVSIKNFRSIISLSEKTRNVNIFVGQNDEGKSNVLRALDLFFNHGNHNGYAIDWSRDYCCFAPKRVGKAEEIEITLEITPPPSFANKTPVLWKKVWRKSGLHSDTLLHADKSSVKPTSKILPFIKAMRFDYVPAIKGGDYFQSLMSKLHDMLEATVEEEVRSASGAFTKTINDNTKPILDEILVRLGLQTSIQLPPNLRDLFAQLEFTSISGSKPFSLQQRGDGVKVRHIPIVLRWLAEQANHLSAPGRPKTVTIWGYEEPENNLELRRCFELAKEFVDGSDEIQAFVTTHSPAFYSVFRHSDPGTVGLFLVTKDTPVPTTRISPIVDGAGVASLDSSMGLLALLEPHFNAANDELRQLRNAVRNLTDTGKPTIFCEGPSDKIVIEESLKLFFPDKAELINVQCSSHHGGGHTWVVEKLIAWSFSRPTAKCVGVFDRDPDAKKSKSNAEDKMNVAPSGKMAFTVSLSPGDELKLCYSRKISVPFATEEIFPEDVWDFAEGRGWLESRPNPIAVYKFERTDITFDAHIQSVLPEKHLLRLALKKVLLEKKEKLAGHVCGITNLEARKAALVGFKPTLLECLTKLGIN